MIKESKFYKWLDNFWYHHKIKTLLIAFFAIAFIVATVQLVTHDEADIYLIYTGPHVFAVSEIHEVEYAFEQVMSGDRNDDGTKNASLLDISLMTDEQIKVAQEEAKAMGINMTVNKQQMIQTEKQFNTQIFAGEAVICLLDPHWYGIVKDSGGFMKLTDALGYMPDSAIDEYGVRLFDTDFGKYFTAFSKFPEDTILCVRTLATVSVFKGVSAEEKRHEFHIQTFRDAMNFKLPEGWTPSDNTKETEVND